MYLGKGSKAEDVQIGESWSQTDENAAREEVAHLKQLGFRVKVTKITPTAKSRHYSRPYQRIKVVGRKAPKPSRRAGRLIRAHK